MLESLINGSREPSLDEILNEPIIQAMMKRDGIHAREMQYQLHRVAGRSVQNQRRF